VHEPGLALDRPVACAAEEVRLQLDRGEACCAFRQAEDAAVPAGRVGERDDRAGVQVAVRRLVLRAELEPRAPDAVARLEDLDTEEARQPGRAGLLQLGERELHRGEPTLAPPWPGLAEKS
jgi:hypothetical protein